VNSQDVFVGLIAGLVGVVIVVAMLADWEWFRQMWVRRFLQARLGERVVRLLTILFGIAMLLAGLLIARGFSLVELIRG
jgi:hypothetical protein